MAERNKNRNRSNTVSRNSSVRRTAAGSGHNTRSDRKRQRRQRISQNKVKSMKLAVMMLIILLAFTGLGGVSTFSRATIRMIIRRRSCLSSAMIPRRCRSSAGVSWMPMERSWRRARKCTMSSWIVKSCYLTKRMKIPPSRRFLNVLG